MGKLTKKEQAWVDDLQEVLRRCPSKRLGFYTIGDPNIAVYDKGKDKAIDDVMMNSNADFGPTVDKLDAKLGSIWFPSSVHSTAG